MHATVIPTLRYRDAQAAIERLCAVFGFTRHLIVPDDAGGVAHAELVLGGGMIMLGSVRDDAFGHVQKTPADVGGVGTQSPYVVVADPDAVLARATAAGFTVVRAIRDEAHGGRGFACRDPEGHLWNVGSYDPWEETA